jgi:transposase
MMVAVPGSSPIPLRVEKLYVGVDIGRKGHWTAFQSKFLLQKNGHHSACPAFPFKNSRLDFEILVREMQLYAPLDQCIVVMERTGHYHLALLQYLLEKGIEVYLLHVQKKPKRQKNDRRDAQGLANTLYSQLELGAQPDSATQEAHRVLPIAEVVQALRSLTRYRCDLAKQISRVRNKLTAINDTLFPEFSQILKDVNCPTALALRECFPTPADVIAADPASLRACRIAGRPSDKALSACQELARTTIGIKAPSIVRALALEQGLLIKQLRLLQENEEALKQEIAALVASTREGQILLSLGDFVGALAAGEIIAAIGTIENFEKPWKLKGYAGWCPVQDQTGTSRDSMMLSKAGNRMLRQTMCFVGMRAIQRDTEWRTLHDRLVERLCPYDARLKRRKGKMKVLSRVIGQILTVMYTLLKQDTQTLAQMTPGGEMPPPALYNRARHRGDMMRKRR